tara:strand:- start:571 stop:834 length:264 start_codon:yes stop_codon:yes gene_type:complete
MLFSYGHKTDKLSRLDSAPGREATSHTRSPFEPRAQLPTSYNAHSDKPSSKSNAFLLLYINKDIPEADSGIAMAVYITLLSFMLAHV